MASSVEPRRTCVGCRTVAPQRELVRLAATERGVEVGRTLRGRGVWLCGRPECLEAALSRGGLSRALRVDRSEVDADAIRAAVLTAQALLRAPDEIGPVAQV